MHAYAVVDGLLDAGNHVGITRHQDKVGDLALHCGDNHVCDEACIHGLLCAALAPFDELAGAQLYAIAHAQGALVAVGAGIGDSVVPVLTVNTVAHLVFNHAAEGTNNLGQINL